VVATTKTKKQNMPEFTYHMRKKLTETVATGCKLQLPGDLKY
jgi:hypothetical protein